MKHSLALILLGLVLSSKLFASTEQLWFSDQPPDKSMIKKMRMRHGGYVHVDKGVDVKQLWLRRGESLQKSAYLESAEGEYQVLNVQADLDQSEIEKNSKQQSIRFPMPDEGYYNAYFTERLVSNSILGVKTAKAEILKHNCRNGHKYDRNLVNSQQWNDAPLDIVRLRLPEEDFHTRIRSGTLVKFQVFHQGKPVVGANVKLETKRGWIKSTLSDKQGIASFQIIQDNFFDADKAEKEGEKVERGHGGRVRIRDGYLVTAQYQTDEAGILADKVFSKTEYTVSSTGRYYPQQLAKKSSEQALWFASAGMLVMGVGGYSYRRRRVKPFKEEQFDEH
ncbi:MAG: hypothetical protein GQ532_16755 [Methylomarinum sp.]|nr:hypothetical protein [Methylomarinum sp.]